MDELGKFFWKYVSFCVRFRCELANEIYDDILKNQNDAESKIILKTIDRMTKVFANFAKYG